MVSAAMEPDHGRRKRRRGPSSASRSLLGICGSLIALLGVVLAVISSSSSLDAELFLQFSGFGLILSGALLARRHIAGAWTYLAVFAATLGWSLENTGMGGSSVAYRIVGPIVMLCILALLMPALRRWSRARTLRVLSVLVIGTVLVGNWSASTDRAIADRNLSASTELQTGSRHQPF